MDDRRDHVVGLQRVDPFQLFSADAHDTTAGNGERRTPLTHSLWRVSSMNVTILR